MTKEEKINLIKENEELVVLALEQYVNNIYKMTDEYFDTTVHNGKILRTLKKGLEHNEKMEKFILDSNEAAEEYDKIRLKIKNKDFNLSLAEIAEIAVSFNFCKILLDKQYKYITNSQKIVKELISSLMSSLDIDELKIKS